MERSIPYRYEISCPDVFSRCSEEERKTPITIFASQLHMHTTGARMMVQQVKPCAHRRMPSESEAKHRFSNGCLVLLQRRAGNLDTIIEGQFYNFAFQDHNA